MLTLSQAGKKVETAWLSEKLGYPIEEAPEPVMPVADPDGKNGKDGKNGASADSQPPIANSQTPRTPIKNRDGHGLTQTGTDAVATAVAEDLSHVFGRLDKILGIQDDQVFAAKLQAFLDDFPRLQKDILADPAAARALQPVIAGAFLDGLKSPKTTKRA